MTDQEFNQRADVALAELDRALSAAADEHEFEIDMHSGALTVEFEDPPTRFVVSPNSPVRQVWLSALSKSFKLDWDPERETFVLKETGQSLTDLVREVAEKHLGRKIAVD